MRAHLTLGLALAALSLAGCEADTSSDESNVTSGLTKTMTLRFSAGTGAALSLKASGKNLTCGERFEGIAGERVTCQRSGETLEVIVKSKAESGVVVVRDLGAKRGYYACTRKGTVGGVPEEMSCKLTELRPRGTGGLSSPFDSSVAGISVPNTHWVDDDKSILRGMEPRTPAQFEELKSAGIERVVIFKNSTGKDDVAKEIDAWDLPESDVVHVPFKWKDFTDFKGPCEQTLQALRFIRDSVEDDKKVLFHCTVGEDRTGYLAALHGVLFEGSESADAFDDDMCEHGYASGNPQKPGFVLGKLEDDLTPLYRAMAFLIQEGKLTDELEPEVCETEPDVPDDFMSELSCGTSTTLVP